MTDDIIIGKGNKSLFRIASFARLQRGMHQVYVAGDLHLPNSELGNWTVADIELLAPVSVNCEQSIEQAEQELIVNRVSEIYVTSRDARLLGVVPDYEFLKQRIMMRSMAGCVTELMTTVSVALTRSMTVEQAALMLRQNVHRSLPVIEQGMICGVIGREQLLRFLITKHPHSDVPVPDRHESHSFPPSRPRFLQLPPSQQPFQQPLHSD